MTLELSLLGPLKIHYNSQDLTDELDRKSLALLCYLALNKSTKRDELAELLWGAGKLNNLRQALYKVRQLEGSEQWFIEEENLNLNASIDVHEFETQISEHNYKVALSLWQGNLLEGFKVNKAPAFMDWLELERSRLFQLYQETSTAYLEELEREARFEEALPIAKQLLKTDPLNETAHRSIMQLEHKQGNTDAALEQFEKLRELLQSELQAEPLEETLNLLTEIEQGGTGAGKNALIISKKEDIPNLPEHLIGRDDLIKEAQDLMTKHNRLLIHGFGGIGKTALTSHLASSYLKQGNILWLELGQSDPATAFDALAKVFDAPQLSQAQDKASLLKQHLNEHKIKAIILDDVWNAYTLSILLAALPEDTSTLISSRQRYPKLKRLTLGRLERQDSLSLLSHHADKDLTSKQDANALCQHLGDHAYALRIAGTTLKQTQLSPAELLKNIIDRPHDLRIPETLNNPNQGSIANLLQVSLENLNDRAYEAFLSYGCLYAASATPELIAKLLERDVETIEDALFTLNQHGLAERQTTAGSDLISYQIHDLAHSYTKAINNYRPQSFIRAAKQYLETHKNKPEALDADIQNILAASEKAANKTQIDFMDLLTLKGSYYSARGHTPKSLKLLEKAAQSAQNQEKLELAHDFYGKLGDSYQNVYGDLETALSYYFKALEFSQKANNKGREAVFLSLIGLVKAKLSQNDSAIYLSDAYTTAIKSKDKLSLCKVLDHNGYVAGQNNHHEQAAAFFSEKLEVIQELNQDPNQDKIQILKSQFFSLNNLGQSLHYLGKLELSLEKRYEALELAKTQNNPIWIAGALYSLGETLSALNDHDEAKMVLTRALSLYKENNLDAPAKGLEAFMIQKNYLDAAMI